MKEREKQNTENLFLNLEKCYGILVWNMFPEYQIWNAFWSIPFSYLKAEKG